MSKPSLKINVPRESFFSLLNIISDIWLGVEKKNSDLLLEEADRHKAFTIV